MRQPSSDVRCFLEAAQAADERATVYRHLMAAPSNTPSDVRYYAGLAESYESLARTNFKMADVLTARTISSAEP